MAEKNFEKMSNPEAKIVYDIVHEQFAKDDDLPDLVEVKQKKRKFVPQFGKIVFFSFFCKSESLKNSYFPHFLISLVK